jgi:aspartate aminotransferase
MRISARANSLKPSSTVAVMNRAKALKAQGVDVLNFSAGEPDFNSPQRAKDAAIAAINANQTRYIETAGDLASRELIAGFLRERNRIPGVTADHVIITSGVKMALYMAFQCLFDVPAGDQEAQELLLPVPAWVSFAPMAQLAGAKIVELPTTPESDFKITPEQLRGAISPRSRALLINSPSNPCSTMYTPDELRALAEVVAEASRTVAPDLVIVSDELYQNIVFGDVPFASIGSFASVSERTITINGPGKSFAMTGWRLGWASGSGEFGKKVVSAMTKLQGQSTTCVPAFCLAGLREALSHCQSDLEVMRAAFAVRGALMYDLLRAVPGVKVARPMGAFYVFPDISAHLHRTSAGGRLLSGAADFAAALLDEQQVAVVPGEDFGSMGHRHVRMSFACGEDQIRKGIARLNAFIAGLR